uniref:Uncharacterized protein n=1 Tax=Anguilla anguilla TaxID=7936 RepID=A0A0E9TUE5_ANGAN
MQIYDLSLLLYQIGIHLHVSVWRCVLLVAVHQLTQRKGSWIWW